MWGEYIVQVNDLFRLHGRVLGGRMEISYITFKKEKRLFR